MAMRFTVWAVITPLILANAQAAMGQEAADLRQLEACLTESSETGDDRGTACIGKVSDACAAANGPGSDADCIMREADAWNAIAGLKLSDLVGKSNSDIADSIRSAQADWEKYRTSHCDATGIFFGQYSGSASAQWQAQCLRDSAAQRALLLDDWLMRSEDFE